MEKWELIMGELVSMTDILKKLNDKPMAIDKDKIIINDKEVDIGTIEIDGIDASDYPDFSDAYVSYAESVNGYGLTEAECELLQDKYSNVIYDLIIDRICCNAEPNYPD